ncbi:MAG TPA: CAP domain-containing protein, partial [Acidimicrobiales bacterium]|nr:CAP domain-containing protein [Acidimicrobiales bacterium]
MNRRRLLLLLLAPLVLAVAACNPVMQADAVMRVNETRVALGRPPLRVTEELTAKAQALADRLAQEGRLEHSADLSAGIAQPYVLIGENEGYGSSVEHIHSLLLASQEHFSIMI